MKNYLVAIFLTIVAIGDRGVGICRHLFHALHEVVVERYVFVVEFYKDKLFETVLENLIPEVIDVSESYQFHRMF